MYKSLYIKDINEKTFKIIIVKENIQLKVF